MRGSDQKAREEVLTMEPLECRELVELLTDYLDDALPRTDAERVTEHLESCPGCRTYLDQLRGVIDLLGHIPAEQLPEATQKGLVDTFREFTAGQP